jgi:hypothetical protein
MQQRTAIQSRTNEKKTRERKEKRRNVQGYPVGNRTAVQVVVRRECRSRTERGQKVAGWR